MTQTYERRIARDPYTGVQIRVGVMGSAGGEFDGPVMDLCRNPGRAIGESGCCLLTGACPGMPHETVLGAKEVGGHVVGISPAVSLKEHVEVYNSPFREYDVLTFTGLGLMGRELINIRSSDIVIVAGGRSGTLGEFAIAYEEGKLIGALTGWSMGKRMAGISDADSVNGQDADDLYQKLENVISPLFYHDRERWIEVMRHAIALNASYFNTHRMAQQYVTNAYLP